MRYTKETEDKLRVIRICYEDSTDKYDLECIEKAYKDGEMSKFEYEYALSLLKEV